MASFVKSAFKLAYYSAITLQHQLFSVFYFQGGIFTIACFVGLSTISVPKQENADVTLVLNNVQRLQCLHFKGNSERGRSHIPLVELKAHTQEEMRYSAIGDFFQETSYQSRFMRSYFICPQNQILLSTKYGLGTVFRTKQKKKKQKKTNSCPYGSLLSSESIIY